MRVGNARLAILGMALAASTWMATTGASADTSSASCGRDVAELHPASAGEAHGDEETLVSVMQTLTESDYDLVGTYTRGYNFSDLVVVLSRDEHRIDELARAVAGKSRSMNILFHQSCRNSGDLSAVQNDMRARWGSADFPKKFNTSVDAQSGTVSVAVDDPDDISLVKDLHGDIATVRETDMSRLSRSFDDTPHYGGARIERLAGDRVCSSGFAVITASGEDGMLTAGHCGGEGTRWRAKQGTATSFFGEITNRAPFPERDVAVMTGSTYRNRIYASPEQSWRNVVDDRSANNNESVCLGGQRSEQVCGVVVTDPNTMFCDDAGCTIYSSSGNVPGTPGIVRPGDSGGPVFSRTGGDDAVVHGTIYAGSDPTDPSCADDRDESDCIYRIAYWQNMGTIKSQLGVQVKHS